jgi:hypothetical protein
MHSVTGKRKKQSHPEIRAPRRSASAAQDNRVTGPNAKKTTQQFVRPAQRKWSGMNAPRLV